MQNHYFDEETGEYTGGEDAPARLDPRETELQGKDIFLCPRFATHIVPPVTGANEVAVWDDEFEQWEVKADFRGQVYYERFGEMKTVTEIGVLVPTGADYSLDPPDEEIHMPKLHYGAWVENGIVFHDRLVLGKTEVDTVVRFEIKDIGVGEEKAKTLKMLAGEDACPEWDEWVSERQSLIDEGNTFCEDNFPS